MLDGTQFTIGVDHVGLAVENLALARRFFCVIALAGGLSVRTKVIRRRSCRTERAL
jgi:hypothetical protein